MSRFSSTLVHTAIYMAGLILNRGVAFLLVPLFTRIFTPEAFTKWDLCTTTLILLFPVLDLGMSPAVVRIYHDHESEEDRGRVFSTGLLFVLAAHVLIVGAGFLFARPLSMMIFRDAADAGLVQIVFLSAAVTAYGKQALSLLRTMERSVLFSVLNLVRGVAGPLAILFLVAWLGQGVAGALWGDLFGLAVLAVAALWVCRGHLRPEFSPGMLRSLLAFGLPTIPMSVTVGILTVADRYFLAQVFTLEEMAPYSLGFKIGTLMALFTQSIQLSWPPAAFAMILRPDGKAEIARAAHWLNLLMFFCATGVTCTAPELLRIFAPAEGYAGALVIIPWIAYSYAVHGAVQVVNIGIGISKRMAWAAAATCGAAAAKVAVTYWFITRFGLVGAAVSTLAAFGLELLLTWVIAQHIVHPLPFDTKRMLGLYALSGAALAASFPLFTLPYMWSLPARGLLLAVFGLACLFGLLNRADRAALANAGQALAQKARGRVSGG